MTNTNELTAKLKAAAEKATSGEWLLTYGDSSFDADDALISREVQGFMPICRVKGAHPESGFDEFFQKEQQHNAEFIALANPANVLAMTEALEAAEKRIASLEARTLTVKMPDYVDGHTLGYGEVNHMIDLCADAMEKACHRDGIKLQIEGE
nr:ead/Ea22-like family protein [uncultured Enterobacter sp.]DAI86861.1 MAG TPA: Ead/Ea22-like protein [Caudoviricetes sp.]